MPKRVPVKAYMVGGRRMRAVSAASRGAIARRAKFAAGRVALVQPGVTRVGGFYGRYRGANKELKFFDTSITAPLDATAEVPATGGQLALIPQGVTESTRVGRKCVLKSVTVKGTVLLDPGAAGDSGSIGHMYLVIDKQANGAAAAVTDVFTGTNLALALHNMANSGRFRVLKHWVWPLIPKAGATTAYNWDLRNVETHIRLNLPIEYSSTTGAITEIKSNNLFLIAGTDGNSDDLATFTGVARVRFADG